METGYALLALTPAGWVVLGITAVTITCATAYVYYIDKYPDTPTTNPDGYQKDGKKGKKNKDDGSYWEKDTSNHGGEQWKRWPNRKAKEKGRKPNSVWPDGRIRK